MQWITVLITIIIKQLRPPTGHAYEIEARVKFGRQWSEKEGV